MIKITLKTGAAFEIDGDSEQLCRIGAQIRQQIVAHESITLSNKDDVRFVWFPADQVALLQLISPAKPELPMVAPAGGPN